MAQGERPASTKRELRREWTMVERAPVARSFPLVDDAPVPICGTDGDLRYEAAEKAGLSAQDDHSHPGHEGAHAHGTQLMEKPRHYRIGRADIEARAAQMERVLNKVKEETLRPDSRKVAPRFNLNLTAEILGLSKSQFLHRVNDGKFVGGDRTGSRTLYTLEEVRTMANQVGLRHPFAPGHGIVMTVANFKGGVAKTSTSVTLAQYMAARGYNCLIIDLDPQASATTLFGISPYLDVSQEESVFALYDDEPNFDRICRSTYWPGIDLIAANQHLYGREFALAGAAKDWGGEIFEYLAQKLPALRKRYDLIFIDTQPSLGFLTSTGIFASDHLLVTVPPSSLDFASSVIFWSLLRDVLTQARDAGGHSKFWEGVHVLQTRVDEQDKSTHFIRKLLAAGCEDWLLPDPIPATRVATNAASDFQTVYDVEKYEGSHRSIKRAREAFDKAYAQLHDAVHHTWDVWQNPTEWDVVYHPEADLFDQEADASVSQDAESDRGEAGAEIRERVA